jgi:hypothetical protein
MKAQLNAFLATTEMCVNRWIQGFARKAAVGPRTGRTRVGRRRRERAPGPPSYVVNLSGRGTGLSAAGISDTSLEQGAGDRHTLDLVGALVDLGDLAASSSRPAGSAYARPLTSADAFCRPWLPVDYELPRTAWRRPGLTS